MGCCMTNQGPPPCVADNRCLRRWICLDRIVELLDFFATSMYCLESYKSMVDDSATSGSTARESLWIFSVLVLVASWFCMLMFHFRKSNKKLNILHVGAFLLCFAVPLIVLLVVGLTGLSPEAHSTLETFSIVWWSLGTFALCIVYMRRNDPVNTSAGFEVPGIGFGITCCMVERKLKEAIEFRGENAYGDLLRITQDVPSIIISSVHINQLDVSWYAVLNLSTSFFALVLYLYLLVEKCVPPPPGSKPVVIFGAVLPS
ncbi:unnamed protein product [Symbiodinium necroappetens]|uniref:Uncharacterized protein n=1 Tax=Symbiodinium necroappetens TaxID=1628268 RepID=A0A812ZWT0_9DINO|nr:unnamed protein product [Symbiodinium necroappetens]